jgi:3-hydroxyisobutyrate dehydrogenase-like beta-hydroxyacid dehydrogenase
MIACRRYGERRYQGSVTKMDARRDAGTTVAIIATGEMGAAIGGTLACNGLRVITNLAGRSSDSRRRAGEAGIEDVGSDGALVADADLFLSVVPPARAVELAERIAAAAAAARGRHPLAYLDCNAIAPQTMMRIAAILASAGIPAIDGGIIGPAPRPGKTQPRLYVSGPDIGPALALKDHGLDLRPAGERIGDASAVKLCYAALTKGTAGLFIELSAAAAHYGVEAVLEAEMLASQKALYERLGGQMPETFGKAHRFVGEMREMATAFGGCGLPPTIFEGLADLYEIVAEARRSNSRLREASYPDLAERLARVVTPAE